MAAVTVNIGPKYDVAGARKAVEARITGNNTNTWDSGLRADPTRCVVLMEQNNIVTGVTMSTVNGQIRVTFAATGAFGPIWIRITARH